MSDRVNIGVIGVAGYAAQLIRYYHNMAGNRVRLAAADTSMSTPEDEVDQILKHHDTQRVNGVEALLDHPDLDAVLIATSIDSHLPFAKAALERGLHVHCEKPITATIDEALEMIAARDAANRAVHVGFQDTYGPTTRWVKQQALAGAIGKIRRVTVSALWPRADSYYARNTWAGKIQRDGKWVLDSPANNALCHQLNLAMYLTGPTADESNSPTAVEAELYRGRPAIENYDTCFIRCQTTGGTEAMILLTHATSEHRQPVVELVGDNGTLRRSINGTAELEREGKTVANAKDEGRASHRVMTNNFVDRVTGIVPRSMCEIENAIEPTRIVCAASEAAPVRAIDPAHLEPTGDDTVYAIRDIKEVFDRCLAEFALPSELGVVWATPGGRLATEDYNHFTGVAQDG